MPSIIANGGTTDFRLLDPGTYFYGLFNDFVRIESGDNTIYTHELNDIVDSRPVGAGFLQEVYLGGGNDYYFGGAGNDYVFDGTGNDIVRLGAGDDIVRLSGGNDFYDGGTGLHDAIDLTNLFSDDGAFSRPFLVGFTIDLANTGYQNLRILGFDLFLNFEDIYGTAGHDRFFGNVAANTFYGQQGNDILAGRQGNDTLSGDNGADWLIGGPGRDMLFCSESIAALDRVRFVSIADSSANPALADLIYNFDKGGAATDDRIDLSAIDANPLVAGNQAFLWRGSQGFTAFRGEVRVVSNATDTYVYVDTDTDAAAEMVIIVKGVTGLTGGDFIL